MIQYPLLSIVIATKNRETYCIEAIKSILEIPSDYLQIAISDNSNSQKIRNYLDVNPSDRIIYKYDNSEISSIENFNRAMQLASGEYVCLIGDDDTVLPEIIDAVFWAKRNGVDSLCSNNYIHYYWPGAYDGYPKGLLLVPEIKAEIKAINVKKELNKLLKNGLVNYINYELPKTYHGIVKREIMLEVKRITGNFYGGLSPDIYSVIAVSCIIEKHYSLSTPLTIAGVCKTSTTADNLKGRHSGELKDIPHLKKRGNYIWDNNIPKYYSVSTIWAESGLKALTDLGLSARYSAFNRYPLLAHGILLNRKTILKIAIKKTTNLQKELKINFYFFWTRILISIFVLVIKKMQALVIYKIKNVHFSNVPDISKALNITSKKSSFKNIFGDSFK